jgi:Flp pilus assembly protein TadG
MALMLVPLIAMVAFTIDIGRITMTTAECQNAADAAALAGADQLGKGLAYYNFYNDSSSLSTYESNATTNAQTICALHKNTDIASVSLASVDVEFGYTNASYTYFTGPAGSLINANGTNRYPNTITVTVRRGDTGGTGSAPNPPITMFFAAVLGQTTNNATVNARAILMTADLGGPPSNLLPLALDYNSWNAYIYQETGSKTSKYISNPFHLTNPYEGGISTNGNSYPGYSDYPMTTSSYTPPVGQTGGFSGKDQLQVYPSPGLAPGNFGWLSMDNGSNSDSAIRSWITNGLSSSDQSALTTQQAFTGSDGTTYTDVLFPVKSSDLLSGVRGVAGSNLHNSTLSDWKSIPGFKEDDVKTLESAVGTTAFLPLFAPANGALGASTYQASLKNPGPYTPGAAAGDGQNSYINIVDYVAVTLTTVVGSGGNSGSSISIQPALAAPKGATLINVRPAGSGSSSYVSVTPKLVAIP